MSGSQKVTYQLSSDIVMEVRQAVESGYAPSQSQFVEESMRRSLKDIREQRVRESLGRAANDPIVTHDVARVSEVLNTPVPIHENPARNRDVKTWDMISIEDRSSAEAGVGTEIRLLVISDAAVNSTMSHVTIVPMIPRAKGRVVYMNEALWDTGRTDRTGTSGADGEMVCLVHQIQAFPRSEIGEIDGRLDDEIARKAILDALEVQLGTWGSKID